MKTRYLNILFSIGLLFAQHGVMASEQTPDIQDPDLKKISETVPEDIRNMFGTIIVASPAYFIFDAQRSKPNLKGYQKRRIFQHT